ncbi:hypothetical protein QBC35DRAFT_485605 [Podospora australis]|uniref:Uncharacterized protein n=1 Tax=Podospora australis TaxID=1536484 RepID=A0AAN6X674_9PEZI|nr:hypothetical protein QBC35DRAFT_485605 [Podospora australis]
MPRFQYTPSHPSHPLLSECRVPRQEGLITRLITRLLTGHLLSLNSTTYFSCFGLVFPRVELVNHYIAVTVTVTLSAFCVTHIRTHRTPEPRKKP